MRNDYHEIKYKWKGTLINYFRLGIIARLPVMNNIVNNLNCNDRESVTNALNDFTNVLRNVTDPLFSKRCHVKSDYGFDNVFIWNSLTGLITNAIIMYIWRQCNYTIHAILNKYNINSLFVKRKMPFTN